MFILSRIQDSISIHPNAFGLDPEVAVKDSINDKYANRLVPGVGLALSVYDILTCTEGTVRYGDGLIWYKTIFRVVVFSPTPGEVLTGKVKGATPDYLQVTLGFFEDIYVPKQFLLKGSKYNHKLKLYTWTPVDDDEENGETEPAAQPEQDDDDDEAPFYYDDDQPVRFRVESLQWQEVEPEPPSVKNKPRPIDPVTREIIPPSEEELKLEKLKRERDAPLKIIADMNEQGMGLTAWWKGAAAEEEEAAPEDEPME